MTTKVSILGYKLNQEIYHGSRTIVYRAIRESDGQSVVVKILKNPCPSLREKLKFRHQYIITKNLNIPGIIKAYTLENYGNRDVLVMEDFAGISLQEYIQICGESRWDEQSRFKVPLCLQDTLSIALQITDTLACLHQNSIIHKDIKPANILINPESKQIKLIDFSIASSLAKDTQEIESPEALEGTLAYLSPEQTGRMNRGIDYRCDFYSLGVTLFELLTGELPFQSDDPMELVYLHVAKMPPRVEERSPARKNPEKIPSVIADIIMKLMAKNPEDRYQSALGLKADLQHCWQEYQRTGTIENFKLGQSDRTGRLHIPTKLYGRQAEMEKLGDAFERCRQGNCELVVISGYSGVGKTALIEELMASTVGSNVHFISGKFDRLQQNLPYYWIGNSYGKLIRQILSESQTNIEFWRDRFLAAVGENGQLMIDVVPELELLIGKQPQLPELPPVEAKARFMQVFEAFASAAASPQFPLIEFIDDLQWVDSSTISVLPAFLMNPENQHRLVIMAYRHNEVEPTHPLMQILANMKAHGLEFTQISLQPLSLEDVTQFIADSLNCLQEKIQPLAKLVYEKTLGNPFFVSHLLKSLHSQGLLKFDFETNTWNWDIPEIQRQNFTDNVVDLMVGRLQQLPPSTQTVLQLAACIGNQFDLNTLAIINQKSPAQTRKYLWEAIQTGLVVPLDQYYQPFLDTNIDRDENLPTPQFKFSHGRIQEVAYALIHQEKKLDIHLQIARLLRHHQSPKEVEANIFEIVNHANLAMPAAGYAYALLTTAREREDFARLNLIAGRKAKAASAYERAFQYLNAGLELVNPSLFVGDVRDFQPSPTWKKGSLLFDLTEELAETAYMCGNLPQMHQCINTILSQTSDKLDRVKAYSILIEAHASESKFIEAIATARQALQEFHIHLPINPTLDETLAALQEVRDLLADKTCEDLLHLPRMENGESLAIIDLLAKILSATYITEPALYPLLIVNQVKLLIRHGNTAISAQIYANYGILLAAILQEMDLAYQFGQLAQQLVTKVNDKSIQAKTNVVISTLIPCKSHCRESLPVFLEGFQAGVDGGAWEFAGYNAAHASHCSYLIGINISQVALDANKYVTKFRKHNLVASLNLIDILFTSIQQLQASHNPVEWETQTEQLHQRLKASKDLTGLHIFYSYKLINAYLLDRISLASQTAPLARKNLIGVAGSFYAPTFYCYDSLTALANYPSSTTDAERTAILKKVAANQEELQLRAMHAPMNFQHKYDLVEAQKYQVLGDKFKALEMYDRAIAGAIENGYIQEVALANELAGKFYLSLHKPKLARVYLQEAYDYYQQWGALTKTQQLTDKYPHWFASASPSSHLNTHSQGSTSTTTQYLDFQSILKASAAISREIVLEQLLQRLLHIVLENSGAEKGCIVLERDGKLLIEVTDTQEETPTATVNSIPLETSADVPVALLQYVARVQEPLICKYAATETMFAANPYIQANRTKSILCVPILSQGKFLGLVYLENNLVIGAFNSDRLEFIKILVAQAGIAIENAQLYALEQEKTLQLQRSESRFRQLIERSADAILLLDPETITFSECNQAAVDLIGCSCKENLIGLNPLDISPEIQWDGIPSPEKAAQVVNLVFENGSHKFDWLHHRVDGKIIWVEIVLTLMQIDEKSIFQCVWRDISDRKRAELALKQQEAEYRTIFESVNDGLAIWDLETGECVKCNPKQSQIYGYSQEEFLDLTPADFIHPDYQHLFVECMETIKVGREFYAEPVVKHKDGSFFDIEVRGTQCVYNGKPHGLFIARDITQQKAIEKERKLSETNLRISEQRFRDVTEAAGVYIWEVDTNGIYTYITEKVEQVKGHSASELLGRSPFEFMHPEDIPAAQAILEKVHNQKERLVLQHRNILPNGEITWEEVTGMVMTNEQGEVIGFRGTGMSITERKIAEAHIQLKNHELEQTLTQLKQTQAQVVQSEKMSALGNLVAGVAHEINNPVGFLNGSIGNIKEYMEDIFGHLELCQEQVQSNPEIAEHAEEIDLAFLTEDLAKMLDAMQGATNRIKNISTSLRTFSRADTEKPVFANLHDGLNSTLLILKYRLKANEKRPAITIIKDYSDLPEIECFPGQLNQVFMNILANAIDMFDEMAQNQTLEALAANPQTIAITTKATNGWLEICIKDNGKGMTPEIQTKIFEHLFTTKEVGKGTGLGLAIAKQIIEETHNGKLTCNSQPGQGTEFAIAIPIS